MQYKINETAAIYDVIDGEIVVIHLESGNYYHLEDSGALVWKLLAKQASTEQITEYLAASYGQKTGEVSESLEPFMEKLVHEGLVLAHSDGQVNNQIEMPAAASGASFSPPVIKVFTDMQDFLLVDPIHEVDEQGLPKYTPPVIDDL